MAVKYCILIFLLFFLSPNSGIAQAYWYYQQGEEFFYGTGGRKQSYENAFLLYSKAADKGSPDAEYKISVCYHNGYGVEQSDRKAFLWAKKAAKHGNAQSQNAIGIYYYTGTGCAQSYAKGIKWLTRSANRGNLEAIHNLEQIGGYPKIIIWFPDE